MPESGRGSAPGRLRRCRKSAMRSWSAYPASIAARSSSFISARHRKLHPGLLCRVEDEVDVLLHQRRGERRGEVVPQERLGLVLDERRAGGRVSPSRRAGLRGRRRRLRPSTRASDINWASPAIMRLIASFTIRACSPSPTCWTVGPIARMTGSTRSNVSSGPETMMLRFPARTTVGLPLTGARR